MASLNKVHRMSIRLTPDQERRATAAAKITSRLKGETVAPSTLVRELAMPQIDQIIAEAGRVEDRATADEDDLAA